MDEITPFVWGDGFETPDIPVINLTPVTVGNNKRKSYSSPSTGLAGDSLAKNGSIPKVDGNGEIFPDDTSFTIYIKVLENGSAVLEAYEKKQPNSKDIYFFCEATDPKKSNLFGTFVLVKYGKEYRTLIANLKEKKVQVASRRQNKLEAVLIDSFEAEVDDNVSIINGRGSVSVTSDQIKYAMEGELYASDTNKKTFNDIYTWYNDGVTTIIDKIHGLMESAKFTREDYQPQKEKPVVSEIVQQLMNAATTGLDYLIPDAVENFISNSFESAFSVIKQLSKKALPQSWIKFLERIYGKVQQVLAFFKNTIKNIPDVVGEAFLLLKAVLMGYVNGLISTAQMLVSFCGWILKTHANDTLNGQLLRKFNSYLEVIEDIYDLIADKIAEFEDAIANLIKDFSVEKLESLWSVFADKLSGYNRYDYAYFAGSFIFEVVLSVILAFFTGGATAVAEAANMTEKFAAFLKLVGREAISVVSGGVLDLLQIIKNLLNQFFIACQKGWKSLKSLLKKLLSKATADLQNENSLREKIDDLDELINQVNREGKVIRDVFISEIVQALSGITEQSSRVADALSNGLIRKKIVPDSEFEFMYKTFGGGNPEKVSAFAYANFTYFRESTPAEVFFKELVHEGTHVLDDISKVEKNLRSLKVETGKLILQGEQMSKYIKSLKREQIIEFRARFFEREFELATGIEPDFESIKDMITFIKKNY